MMSTAANLPECVNDPDHITRAIQAHRAKTGRPTIYTPELAAIVLDRIANGESIRKITNDATMPSWPTIWDWKEHIPVFATQYAQVRLANATAMVQDGLDILDNADDTNGMAPVQKADKRAQFRLNLAKCYDRDTYGDQIRQDVNVRGVQLTTTCAELQELMDQVHGK